MKDKARKIAFLVWLGCSIAGVVVSALLVGNGTDCTSTLLFILGQFAFVGSFISVMTMRRRGTFNGFAYTIFLFTMIGIGLIGSGFVVLSEDEILIAEFINSIPFFAATAILTLGILFLITLNYGTLIVRKRCTESVNVVCKEVEEKQAYGFQGKRSVYRPTWTGYYHGDEYIFSRHQFTPYKVEKGEHSALKVNPKKPQEYIDYIYISSLRINLILGIIFAGAGALLLQTV